MKNNQNFNQDFNNFEGDDDMQKVLLAIDAGNGLMKLAYREVRKLDDIDNAPLMLIDFPSTVEANIEANVDTDTIIMNGKKCKINSGVKVGQRLNATKKTNEHTIANIQYAIYKVAEITGIKKFDIAVGVTQDLYDDEQFQNIYMSRILNTDENKLAKKLKNRETFTLTYKKPEERTTTEIEILSVTIRPESVSGLGTSLAQVQDDIVMNTLGIKEEQLDNVPDSKYDEVLDNARLWVIDLGTLTSHYTIYENRTTKLKAVTNNGYATLVGGFGRHLEVVEGFDNSFDNADKVIRQNRKPKEFKKYAEQTYLKNIKEEVVSYGADENFDHFLFIGGTSDELKDYIPNVFTKNTTIADDGFHANVLGMFKRLQYEVKVAREEELKRRREEREKEKLKKEKELQEVATTTTEDGK